jgi:hypothetical protein
MVAHPPGLSESNLNDILNTYQRTGAILRVARYDRDGGTHILVYDVCDDSGEPILTSDHNRATLGVAIPKRVKLPIGTDFPIGTATYRNRRS